MFVEAILLYFYIVQVFGDFELKLRWFYGFAWGQYNYTNKDNSEIMCIIINDRDHKYALRLENTRKSDPRETLAI